jgi:hypothetical protein
LFVIQTNQQFPEGTSGISSFYTQAENTIDIQPNNSVLILTGVVPVENQSGVMVGRLFLSLVQDEFKVIVPTYSPYPVKVVFSTPGQTFIFQEINIQPGQCFLFIPELSENISPAGTFSAGFNAVESTGDENTISFITLDECDSIVYNTENKLIQGRYAYSFDSYCTTQKRIFGSRNGTTFELNKGDFINGKPILFSLSAIHNFNQVRNNEFIKYRLNGDKPTGIEFYMDEESFNVLNFACRKTQFFSKAGFEFFIPRQIENKNRLQGRVMISRIIHNLAGGYKILTAGVQSKEL